MSFDDAFSSLTGTDGSLGPTPFHWQRRLYERMSNSHLPPPSALDLPTGLGKTSAIPIWLLARAVNPLLPRRLVYVVDRRAVVDQATEVAQALRDNLTDDLAAAVGVPKGRRLAVSALRGRLADNQEWLEDPSAPAIIIGTVDMIGSRLLFSGYGTSRGMRPVHAALLGCDSLIMLDEAHLSRPFHRLVDSIEKTQEFWPDAAAPRLCVTSLSATGADLGAGEVFSLTEEDLQDPIPKKRLASPKRLTVEGGAKPVIDLANCAKDMLAEKTDPTRIVLFVTGRDAAQKIMALLSTGRNALKDTNVHLLTGAQRGAERDGLVRRLTDAGFIAGGARSACHEVLISTAAGEVGVDIDADHMIADLMSWERMVQRLGRVNRRGEGSACVRVIDFGAAGLGLGKKKEKEEELARRAATRALLLRLPEIEDEKGGVSASPGAIAALDAKKEMEAASTPEPLHPGLSLPLLDAWSMTSLAEHSGRPDVAPWIRGWVNDEPQATIAWRAHLPVRSPGWTDQVDPVQCARFFEAAPLGTAELLEMSAAAALEKLAERARQIMSLNGDGERAAGLLLGQDGALLHAISLDDMAQGVIGGRSKEFAAQLLGAGRLVLRADFGGLKDGLLDASASERPATADCGAAWAELLGEPSTIEDSRLPDWQVKHRDASSTASDLQVAFRMDAEIGATGNVKRTLEVLRCAEARLSGAPWLSRRNVPLESHEEAVACEARRIAGRLLGDPAEVEAVARAAELHDHGKASALWQERMGAPRDGRIYAKTRGGQGKGLDGYRHELGSLLAARNEDLPDGTRDLTLHLIASHHGNARPGISISNVHPATGGAFGQDGAPPSALKKVARDAALRFWDLQGRHGPWGLAWREEMLRAADRIASQAEEANSATGGA
jgi:CRISPR-associated endonuclease/helicase Cas3